MPERFPDKLAAFTKQGWEAATDAERHRAFPVGTRVEDQHAGFGTVIAAERAPREQRFPVTERQTSVFTMQDDPEHYATRFVLVRPDSDAPANGYCGWRLRKIDPSNPSVPAEVGQAAVDAITAAYEAGVAEGRRQYRADLDAALKMVG